MEKPKEKLSKEEILEKKRVAERLRYERIKRDPVRFAAQREKERQKYLKQKEKGQRKLVSQMSPREKREARKKWKCYSSTYYFKKSSKKNVEGKFC